jgi:hypothetical protein
MSFIANLILAFDSSPYVILELCRFHVHGIKVCRAYHSRGHSAGLMIPKILFLVEQIRPRTTQIDDLRTPISVFLESGALETVEGIRDALATAYDTLVLVVAEGAFVADAGKGGRAHVGVAHRAFAVTLVAEAADGDAGLLAAHYKISRHTVSTRGRNDGGGELTDDGETWWR